MALKKQLEYPRGWKITAGVLLVFGLITLFAAGGVLFNDHAREVAGRVVPVVLWMNFATGFLYIGSALGMFGHARWAPWPLVVALALLGVAAVGFFIHVQQGMPYEPRTMGALAFRILATAVLFLAARYFNSYQTRKEQATPRF